MLENMISQFFAMDDVQYEDINEIENYVVVYFVCVSEGVRIAITAINKHAVCTASIITSLLLQDYTSINIKAVQFTDIRGIPFYHNKYYKSKGGKLEW